MLDIREIEYWISRYEQEADKLDHCVTLSALYSIRDELTGRSSRKSEVSAPVAYSEAAPLTVSSVGRHGDSDFFRAIEGKDPGAAWAVINEHMDALHIVNPRAYEGVMTKLRGI